MKGQQIDKQNQTQPSPRGSRFLLCSLILTSLALAVSLICCEYVRALQASERDLVQTAAVIGAAVKSSQLQDNQQALGEYLDNLSQRADISAASVFDSSSRLLATTVRPADKFSPWLVSPDDKQDAIKFTPGHEPAWLAQLQGAYKRLAGEVHHLPGENGWATALYYDGSQLSVLHPLLQNQRLIGQILLAKPLTRDALLFPAVLYALGWMLPSALIFGLLGFGYYWQQLGLPLHTFVAALENARFGGNNERPAPTAYNHPLLARLAKLIQFSPQEIGEENDPRLLELSRQIATLQADLARAEVSKGEAEQANQRKAEFLANMSHEIRTPMTAVLGMADFLWHSKLTPDQRRSIAVMKQTSSMLISIVDDIIDFAKIESGRLSLNLGEFNCNELFTDSYQLLALEAKTKGLKYKLEIAAEFPNLLIGDAGRISQIVVNLLSNAIKFTAQGEIKMRVSASSANGKRTCRLLCEVTDTGIGISKDKLDLLFKAFSQTDNAMTRIFPGSGLGLAISKQLVQLMGGEIGVSSQPGIGSTFWFWLDLAVSDKAVKTIKPLSNYRFNARVLVAEDYPANQMVVQRFLEDLGCTVFMVNNGFEAVKEIKKQYFDLIFMDCQMPFMDGYQATREIRRMAVATRRGQAIPIIALTAHALQEDENRCKAAGMDEWVTKPFTRHDLGKILQKWLPEELILPDQPALKTDAVTLAKASNIIDDTSSINLKFFTQQFKLDNIDDLAFIHSLTHAFQQNAAQVLGNLQLSIDDGDTESVRKLAHGLKSISTNVGSGSLTDLCSLMEQAGQSRNLDGVQELLDSMKQEYLRVLSELNSLCARA